MSSLVSRRARAATSSLLLAAVALSGCSLLGGGGSKSTDISKLPNIPQGQKQQLVQQMQSASGDQKKQIAEEKRRQTVFPRVPALPRLHPP